MAVSLKKKKYNSSWSQIRRTLISILNQEFKDIEIIVTDDGSKNNFSKNNITSAIVLGTWHTRRYFLDGNEGSGFYWSEEELRCSDLKIRYNPKE